MDVDDEVRLRVLEERVRSIGRSTREAEKCCGALRGDAQRLGERVVVLEHDLNGKCAGMVGTVDGIVEDVSADHKVLELLGNEVDILRSRLWWAVTIALGALFLDIIQAVH